MARCLLSAEERFRLREAEGAPGLAELKCLIESVATTATPYPSGEPHLA